MNTKSQASKVSGIYKIINKINDKYYVGSSDNITGTSGRWMEHITNLNANRHDNSYLQRAWNKYGQHSFDFEIMEMAPKSKLLLVEQTYLTEIKNNRRKFCYNLSFSACGGGYLGHKHSNETKRRISEKLMGRVVSKQTRRKQSKSLKGRIPGFANKTHSDEWKLANGLRMKKYWKSKRKSIPPQVNSMN